MPVLLHRLCTLCAASCRRSRACFPAAAHQPLASRRRFARQSSGKLVAQARKSALLRELEELQQEAEDSQTPAGEGSICLSRFGWVTDASRPSLFAVTQLQWSSPLDIVRYPDPRLRAKNARINVFDDSLKQLASEMFDIMYR